MAWFGSQNSVTKGALPPGKGLKSPPPVAPASLLGGLAPPDASQTRSNATAEALLAAKRARKRGAASTLVTGQPTGAGINPPAVLAPKSLVGY